MQDLGDAHDTPSRLLLVAPAGFGVRWIDQLVPFHRSASVAAAPVRLVENPTAVQELSDAHDTPSGLLDMPPAGFGVCCTAQPKAEAPGAIASHSASVTNPTTRRLIGRLSSAALIRLYEGRPLVNPRISLLTLQVTNRQVSAAVSSLSKVTE